VRSDSAPNSGFATSVQAAPAPSTRASAASFSAGASASTCCGSRIWIGPNSPAYSPIQASTNRSTQPADTRSVGSASPPVDIAPPTGPQGRGPEAEDTVR
jgi:hypothetical protein